MGWGGGEITAAGSSQAKVAYGQEKGVYMDKLVLEVGDGCILIAAANLQVKEVDRPQ